MSPVKDTNTQYKYYFSRLKVTCKSIQFLSVSVTAWKYIRLRHLSATRLVENRILSMISWDFLGLPSVRTRSDGLSSPGQT